MSSGQPGIHCHTVCDKRTVDYVRFTWEAMQKLAARPDRLRLTVHCMGPRATDIINGEMGSTSVRAVTAIKPSWVNEADPMAGSVGHGVCVEAALRSAIDSDIHVIADADTVVVARAWDNALRQKLVSCGFGIVGSTYEPIGGFSSGNGDTQTYKDAPTVTWMALAPGLPWHSLQVRPAKEHSPQLVSQEEAEVHSLPVGHFLLRDVGWQIPRFLKNNGIKHLAMPHLKHNTGAVVLRDVSAYSEEFHLDGAPFVVHQRGSLSHPYRSPGTSSAFYSAVDAYLAIEEHAEPRWAW